MGEELLAFRDSRGGIFGDVAGFVGRPRVAAAE